MNALGLLRDVKELKRLKSELKKEKREKFVSVCGDTGCSVWDSKKVDEVFRRVLEEKGLSEEIPVKSTGCLGFCECGPVVIVFPEEIFYQKVNEEDVEEIVEETVVKGKVVERLLYHDPREDKKIVKASDIPFYKKQVRNLLGDNWLIDPGSIVDYFSREGYAAAAKAFTEMSPEEVINEIKEARLRGRGGAGFPTGVKWEECFTKNVENKYIICNADEGDPGAFMDRSILEGNPHSVLEGMMIGGYATGSNHGIVYIREEYPTALEKVKNAILKARETGMLGENILNSGFDFDITVSVGAGAFVCGETSALVNSIEGKVGEPRQKPPHLAEKGLYGKPTVVNNVETLANVPRIIRWGAEEFARAGSKNSGGTKIFSLVGKIRNTGLVEVPLGLPLREIIYEIGGGIKGGGHLKAVQTGGPSGGCLPGYMLDIPTDFEELDAAGSMMGSGGMIVMDYGTCMVEFSRYFLSFLSGESCGKCFSCREGIYRMLEIVEEVAAGTATLSHLDLLEELGEMVKNTTMCGLGKTSANPVLSTLKFFKGEYLAHIMENRCPAGVCRALVTVFINQELCSGCGVCRKKCPEEAITGEKKEPHYIEKALCSKCGICIESCPEEAITRA